jgi:hypothetical protein
MVWGEGGTEVDSGIVEHSHLHSPGHVCTYAKTHFIGELLYCMHWHRGNNYHCGLGVLQSTGQWTTRKKRQLDCRLPTDFVLYHGNSAGSSYWPLYEVTPGPQITNLTPVPVSFFLPEDRTNVLRNGKSCCLESFAKFEIQ